MIQGVVLLLLAIVGWRGAAFRASLRAFADARWGVPNLPALAQEAADDEESEVPPDQVEKYIAVYKAMQRDHNLKVEQAAAAQGLSLSAFRDIEERVERDDMIRDRVRQALRRGEAGAPSASSSPAKAK
jgi:hypothetical protein